jgi:hypothetical protein
MKISAKNIQCKSLHASIPIKTCLRRQFLSDRKTNPAFGQFGSEKPDFSMCIDCKAGKKLQKETTEHPRCKYNGCDRFARSIGLCEKHYRRQWHHNLKKDPQKYERFKRDERKHKVFFTLNRISGEQSSYLDKLDALAKQNLISRGQMAKKIVMDVLEFHMNRKKSIYE